MQGSAIQQPQGTVPEQGGHHGGHGGHPDHRLFGIALFLVAESSIFMGLFAAFLIYRTVVPVWPPEGTPELELLLPGI